MKDKVLVAAMVDRITHKAHLVNMSGQSYRVKEMQKMRRNAKDEEKCIREIKELHPLQR